MASLKASLHHRPKARSADAANHLPADFPAGQLPPSPALPGPPPPSPRWEGG